MTIQGWERHCKDLGFTTKTRATLEGAHICTLGALMCLSEAWISSLQGTVLSEAKTVLGSIANEKGKSHYTLRHESVSVIRRINEVFPQPGNTPVGILGFTHNLRPVTVSHFIGMNYPTLGSLAFALRRGTLFGILTHTEHEEVVNFLKKSDAWSN